MQAEKSISEFMLACFHSFMQRRYLSEVIDKGLGSFGSTALSSGWRSLTSRVIGPSFLLAICAMCTAPDFLDRVNSL